MKGPGPLARSSADRVARDRLWTCRTAVLPKPRGAEHGAGRIGEAALEKKNRSRRKKAALEMTCTLQRPSSLNCSRSEDTDWLWGRRPAGRKDQRCRI